MLEFCLQALSVPRREQFSESITVSFEEHNVQGQICEHIFTPNGGYCIYYPSNIFCNTCSLENWGIFNNYSPKWLAVDIYRAAKQRGKYPTLATFTLVNNC